MNPRPTPPPEGIANPEFQQRYYEEQLLAWFVELAAQPHVQEVMNIPSTEPIFVLRSQDINAPDAVDSWLATSQRMVGPSKFLSAATRYQAMLQWQNDHRDEVKVPD